MDPHSDYPSVPKELLECRNRIDAIDNQILELLSARKNVVSEVAEVKKRHALKVRDRVREAAILDDRRSRCDELGLRREVVESLYRVVLTASRDLQAALGTERPPDLERRTVAVIGGNGAMGQLFARIFDDLGQDVLVADLNTTLTPIQAAKRADAVLISVPMDATVEVIKEIGPHVREDGLLFDVTSTKSDPVNAMCSATKADVIGMHPMFGPSIHTMQDQRIVARAQDILGSGIVGLASQLFCKQPHDPVTIAWHQDASYWPLTPSRTVTIWIAIDDADTDNSCMRFVDGSHLHSHINYRQSEEAENDT